MQVTVHEVVDVARVGDRRVSTVVTMDVVEGVAPTGMVGGTRHGIGIGGAQLVAIRVVTVGVMQVAIVKIIQVIFVLYGGMTAIRAMNVGVIVVGLVHDESSVERMMNYRKRGVLSRLCDNSG